MALGNEFIIKQHDTLPVIQAKLYGKGNLGQRECLNLGNASTVVFSMIDNCGDYAIMKEPAQISNPTGGTIQYDWKDGETSEEGTYKGEFEITFSNGSKMSVPQIGGIPIRIIKDINPY